MFNLKKINIFIILIFFEFNKKFLNKNFFFQRSTVCAINVLRKDHNLRLLNEEELNFESVFDPTNMNELLNDLVDNYVIEVEKVEDFSFEDKRYLNFI